MISTLLLAVSLAPVAARADGMDLGGNSWSVRLDRDDRGQAEKWFEQKLSDRIVLPGVLTEQGYGDRPSMQTQWTGNINPIWESDPYYKQYQTADHYKMPFWLQPERHYVGAAWYQRDIEVPKRWHGKRLYLLLERPHWKTTVWLDDRCIGSQDSLGTPHAYELGADVAPGKHRLTLCVDNRMVVDVGVNSHSVSDHTQGNWNGIVGRIQLRATDPVWIDDVRLYPNVEDRTVKVQVSLGNITGKGGNGVLQIHATDDEQNHSIGKVLSVPVSWKPPGAQAECTFDMGRDCQLWDEFRPTLYLMHVTFLADQSGPAPYQDTTSVQFGMRQVGTRGTQITLNGKPVFLRGTLECCIFPITGCPPVGTEPWRRIIRICKAHGLNHIRFHSWCPPEAAFDAADELGFYYYVECSSWANQGSSIGDGRPVDKWLYEEADRMVRRYGNHPSFIAMSYGNEPAGRNQNRWLGDFIEHLRSIDGRRLYTSGAGWPMIPENDFHVVPGPRIQQWGQGVGSRVNARPPETMTDYSEFVKEHNDAPVVSHEIGQWCVYPNFDEMSKYTGLLKPKNFEIFREQLDRNGMLGQGHDFLMASGKLQALLYKEEIESALRTPGFGGFELLDLHDFPGQGTALVGVLDPFWDSKGYITPAEFHRFCGPVVPLARLERRIFESGDTLIARIDLAHFGPADLQDTAVAWTLRDSTGEVIDDGAFASQTIQAGQLSTLGEVRTRLYVARDADEFNLEVAIPGTDAANDWDIWVFPKETPAEPASDIRIAREFNDETVAHLNAGGKVLLLPAPQTIKNDRKHPIQMGFSSIFWNTVWTNWQPPHTLGILCDPSHAALAQFPTEYHTNWQWWELIHGASPFILTEHRGLTPIVQVVDDWVTARKLALVFEARVGNGKLVACSCDLTNDLDKRPVARQMRRGLLAYMAGGQFSPQFEMTTRQVADLFAEPGPLQTLGATVTADSYHSNHGPELAIDGNPTTIWHTDWEPATPMPHHLILDLKKTVRVRGLTYLPRQDMTNGRIGRFELYLCNLGQEWGRPVAKGEWPNDAALKTIQLDTPVEARFVKLVALSEVRGQPFTSVAEVDIIEE